MADDKRPNRTETDIIARLHAIRDEVQKLRDDIRTPAKFRGMRLRSAAEPEHPEPKPAAKPHRGKVADRARKKR